MEVKVHGWPAADQQPSSIHGNPHGNPRATRIGPDRPKMYGVSAGTLPLERLLYHRYTGTMYGVLRSHTCTLYNSYIYLQCTGQLHRTGVQLLAQRNGHRFATAPANRRSLQPAVCLMLITSRPCRTVPYHIVPYNIVRNMWLGGDGGRWLADINRGYHL